MVWHGEKLSAKHFGNIQLKSGELRINCDGRLVGAKFVIDMKSITNQDIESKQYKAMLVDDLKVVDSSMLKNTQKLFSNS